MTLPLNIVLVSLVMVYNGNMTCLSNFVGFLLTHCAYTSLHLLNFIPSNQHLVGQCTLTQSKIYTQYGTLCDMYH